MDKLLFASLGLGAVLLIITVMIIVKKHCRDTGIVVIRETWMTAVLGAMLIVLGFAFPALKLMDSTIAGTESSSYWFTAGFGLLCHLMGDFALLFTCVKCVVLFEDRAVEYTYLGDQNVIRWEDIVRVEKPLMKSYYLLTDRNGHTLRAGGDSKATKTFIEFAKTKVKNASGTDLLHQVEHRLGGRHL